MRRLLLPALALSALVALPASASGGRPAEQPPRSVASIDVVEVEGILDPPLSEYVRDRIRSARATGSAVLLQVDSPGAYRDEGLALARFVRQSGVPVVSWIGPTGSRAEGAALFLVYSGSLVAMAPGAGIGPAEPFDLLGGHDAREAARLRNELVDLGARGGVPREGVARILRDALPAGPARDAGAVGVVARTLPELLDRLDGRVLEASAGPVVLSTRGGAPSAAVRFHEPGPIRRVLHAATTPTAIYVLVVLGVWAIAFELTQPGFGMAGIGGALALALAGYGLAVVPVNGVGFALILMGMAAQGLDVLVRRLGPLTLGGAAVFALGSWLAWRGAAPAVDLAPWLVALATVGGVLFFGFGLTVALRSRERVRTAQLGLVGMLGEVRSDLDPEGGVSVKGALWRARSADGPIPKGALVRVRGVDGLILTVEREPEDR